MPMMKCGHAANSQDTRTGKPCCAICIGIDPRATIPDDNPPDLTGREAKCFDCNRTIPSSPGLAFFSYRPDKALDQYYCGCRGWD